MANPLYGQNKADTKVANNVLETETLTGAGACSIVIPVTFVDTTGGAAAITLAASNVKGAVKHIIMVKDAGDATLTVANVAAVGNTVTLASVGDAVSFVNAADEDGLIIGWCMISRESGLANVAAASTYLIGPLPSFKVSVTAV